MNAPHPLTLTGTLCSMGDIGAEGLASITPETPRLTVQLPDGRPVHLVGLTRAEVTSMAPLFLDPVQLAIQTHSSNPAEFGGIKPLAATPAIALPSDEELREMLFERVEYLADTDQPLDPEREERSRAACELVYLRTAAAMIAVLKGIVRDYHYALDLRQHGGIAQGHALDAIRQRLGMPWVQGAELKARAALVVEAAPGSPA